MVILYDRHMKNHISMSVHSSGFDCGVFIYMFIYFSVTSCPFVNGQLHIDKWHLT